MNFNWYDLFISFSYGVGDFHGVIFIFNPLYVILLIFLPGILVSFKQRMKLPKVFGLEIWQIGLVITALTFILGVVWHFSIQK